MVLGRITNTLLVQDFMAFIYLYGLGVSQYFTSIPFSIRTKNHEPLIFRTQRGQLKQTQLIKLSSVFQTCDPEIVDHSHHHYSQKSLCISITQILSKTRGSFITLRTSHGNASHIVLGCLQPWQDQVFLQRELRELDRQWCSGTKTGSNLAYCGLLIASLREN